MMMAILDGRLCRFACVEGRVLLLDKVVDP